MHPPADHHERHAPLGPTFIGIGAQKAASSWCWRALAQHPDVTMSQPKELDFFTDHFDRGRRWYESHFATATTIARGEFSPLYLDHPETAERVAVTYPDVRLIVLLRDPRERAISNLLHDVRDLDGVVAKAPTARLRELARTDDRYTRRSCYAAALAPFLERFPGDQVKVLFYEDLHRDPGLFLRSLYTAVGVRESFAPRNTTDRVNRTCDYWSPALFKQIQRVSRTAKSWGPTNAGMEWLYRNTRLRERTLGWLEANRGRPAIDYLDVFGEEADRRLSDDIRRLRDEMGISTPKEWGTPAKQTRLAS